MDIHVIIQLIVLSLICSSVLSYIRSPYVRLRNGGRLKGKSVNFRDTNMDLFLGIPYAKAPIGDLRFKKPEEYPRWNGVREATKLTDSCYQVRDGSAPAGNEDCLFLDITVPGRIRYQNKKPVMVWFPGGGYRFGSKTILPGAPLAVYTDVIVVTVNYRLGVFGFLSEGPGTGNFGLWDQRQALLWVKENIAKFGGDPDLVTICGESAGAASVASQLMNPLNEGLFKRAIQQSGTLYNPFSWYLSLNQRAQLVQAIKINNKCATAQSVYDCLRPMTSLDIVTNSVVSASSLAWHPVPDDDFFPSNINDESFDLSKRFDLLSGFSGQEGLIVFVDIFTRDGPFFTAGTPLPFVRAILTGACEKLVPASAELCVEFLLTKYNLSSFTDNRERGVEFSHLAGDLNFVAAIVKQLSLHSKGNQTSTYGYYFTEKFDPPPEVSNALPIPDWIRNTASHFDVIPYIFGGTFIQEDYSILEAYIGDAEVTPVDAFNLLYYNGTSTNFRELTELMMTTFSNFARSGNPNLPVSLPAGTPTWPEYTADTNQLLEFSSFYKANVGVVTTPNKERLDSLTNVLFKATREQTLADSPPVCPVTV